MNLVISLFFYVSGDPPDLHELTPSSPPPRSSDLKILCDASIRRPVNIIVHSLDDVNQSLKRGEYFWVDIARDGIVLYELPCHPLATPMPLTPADAYAMAKADRKSTRLNSSH